MPDKFEIEIDEGEEERLAKQEEGCGSRKAPGATKAFPLKLVMSAAELAAMPIKQKEDVVNGVISIPALGMIVAPSGLGKTRLVAHLVDAITKGRNFLAWPTTRARRMVYIDGELPACDLQGIFQNSHGNEPSELLDIVSSEFFYNSEKEPLTLNKAEHQQRFLLLLEDLEIIGKRPEGIVLDNYSAMVHGIDENSNTEQDSFLQFLIHLRHLGYLVIIVHHTGKSGEQRGASRREDFLDFVIRLSPPDKPSPHGNAKFVLDFSKMRRKMPMPSSLECELVPADNGGLTWLWTPMDREVEPWLDCLRHIQMTMPVTQDEIAEAMGVGKSAISKHLKKARDKGLLDGLRLTDSGRRYLRAVYGPIEGVK